MKREKRRRRKERKKRALSIFPGNRGRIEILTLGKTRPSLRRREETLVVSTFRKKQGLCPPRRGDVFLLEEGERGVKNLKNKVNGHNSTKAITKKITINHK